MRSHSRSIKHSPHFVINCAAFSALANGPRVLLAVKGLPEGRKATISALAERLQLAHHSTVELIDRLAERGFIERCRGEGDQRWVLVSLTSQGEAVLRKLSSAHRAELQSTGPALVEALTLLLRKNSS